MINSKNIILLILGVLIFGGVAYATTTLRDDSLTFSENATISGSQFNYTTNDASIKLYAKDHYNFGSVNGESIELHSTTPTAKSFIGWYAYDLALNKITPVGWFGCHYNLTNGNTHSHCSIETLDNATGTPSINTHFEISYNGSQPVANINFPDSTINLGNYAVFRGGISKITPDTKLDIYPEGQQTTGLRFSNDSTGITLAVLGGTNLVIGATDMLQLSSNTTAMTCNTANTGNLIFSSTKHYGCNGTTWNALY